MTMNLGSYVVLCGVAGFNSQKMTMNLGSDVVLCRVQLIDSRVHACLYFVAPNGHGLRQLDIEVILNILN
jgi:septin family protein